MLRIFLPLYLILAVFFIGFIAAVTVLPEVAVTYLIGMSEEDASKGTFYLVEQTIPDSGFEDQQQAIGQLQTHFGYPIKLLKPHDSALDESDWKHILSGDIITTEIDGAEYDIKKSPYSDHAIAISFSESLSSSVHKTAQGTFYLVQQELNKQPQEKWPGVIAELQTHFSLPIALTRFNELNISAAEKQSLLDGRIIDLDHDESAFDHYTAKLKNSPYVVQVGPIKQPFTATTLLTIIGLSFILSLALALFLWVRPLWKSMNELSRSADDFGQGELNARANVKPRAALGTLAKQFNAMAGRVSGLITGHRELTNAVSHELRTPLARMRFGLDMLENADDYTKPRYLAGLHTDIDDLENLVNELLHYARFERTESLPDLETIKLIPWLEDIIDNARGYAGELKISCIKNDIQPAFTAQAAPRHLARVIHNLLRNACRYSEQEIQVFLKTDQNNVIIHIDDDGIGIPESERERIFDAFARLDDSRNRQSGGHGLGLAIAKRIIEAHNGTITISNAPLGGARFTLIWPISQP